MAKGGCQASRWGQGVDLDLVVRRGLVRGLETGPETASETTSGTRPERVACSEAIETLAQSRTAVIWHVVCNDDRRGAGRNPPRRRSR